ncbi:response regulator [Myxococcota bacterium]|nr:response regulator [Myxococcota bacterium]MBU1431497.1 response regulator [Myxococcota bacterium]MBU1900613.1 response regulator [Myxococcota bacterium]
MSYLLVESPDAHSVNAFYEILTGARERLTVELIHRRLTAYFTGLEPAEVIVNLSPLRVSDAEVVMEAVSSALFKLQIVSEGEAPTDFLILSANRKASACLKIPVEHAPGARFLDASTLADNSNVFMFLLDCYEKKQVKEDTFSTQNTKEKRWYHLRAVPLGSCIYLSAIDVTNEKELEKNQIEDETRKSIYDLIDHAIHELNNKLTPIVVFSGIYSYIDEGEVIDNQQLSADMAVISKSVEESVSIVKWIREISKSEGTGPQLYDLNQTLKVAQNMLRKILGIGFDLKVFVQENLSTIRFPGGQIERIILNLILNAKQAMPYGGLIEIEARQETDWVFLSVKDAGIGIRPEILPHIFKPKFTTKASGTGMGLHCISTLVSSANGRISVTTNIDKGTRFVIQVPAVRLDPELRDFNGRGHCVLVVEDDPFVRPYVLRALAAKGFDAHGAEDLESAMVASRAHHFDLLIIDAILTHSTGMEVISHLRAQGNECPVLLMSGYSGETLSQYGFPEGTPILEKPFTDQQLIRTLRGLLRPDPKGEQP